MAEQSSSLLRAPPPSAIRKHVAVPCLGSATNYFLVRAIDKALAQRFRRDAPAHHFAPLCPTGSSSYSNLLTPDGLVGFTEPAYNVQYSLDEVPLQTALFFIRRNIRPELDLTACFDEDVLGMDEAQVLLREIVAQALADRETALQELFATVAERRNNKEIAVHYQAPNCPCTPAEILQRLSEAETESVALRCKRVRGDLLVKDSPDSFQVEVESALFVRGHTNIPVPEVFLWFARGIDHYLVLAYVPGRCLFEVWPSLGPEEQDGILSQLEDHLTCLRAISPAPGVPPGPLGDDHTCRGYFFGIAGAGPFATEDALYDWMNARMPKNRSIAKRGLVFTHQDISPRNLILDDGGRLWIIDWEGAGWYPPGLEYACVDKDIGYPGCVTPHSWKDAFKLRFRSICNDDELRCLRALLGYVTFFPYSD